MKEIHARAAGSWLYNMVKNFINGKDLFESMMDQHAKGRTPNTSDDLYYSAPMDTFGYIGSKVTNEAKNAWKNLQDWFVKNINIQ